MRAYPLPIRLMVMVTTCLLWINAVQADEQVLFREEFDNLEAWEPYLFPNISRHSTYEIRRQDETSQLVATSRGSASALVFKRTFRIDEYPILRWRWKTDQLYVKGDYRLKSGDDYPIRVYVFFAYDPNAVNLLTRIKYGLAKSIYGHYPPLRSLNYIWANRKEEIEMVSSPFTKRSVMIPLQHGPQNIGTWVEESVNLLEDYAIAFGGSPPARASLAIMNDSDNTGEHSTSYIEFIEVRK